jgi:hypothetical protein
MKIKFNLVPEKNYNEILSEVGAFRYEMFSRDERMPGDLFSRIRGVEDCRHVLVGTGATISNYVFSEIKDKDLVVPKGSQIFVGRFLKYDDSHGLPHYNAYDQIVFPTKGGNIFSFSRNEAPDHLIEIAKLGSVHSLAEAYNLPQNKRGTIEEYKANGASIYIDPEPVWDGDEFIAPIPSPRSKNLLDY